MTKERLLNNLKFYAKEAWEWNLVLGELALRAIIPFYAAAFLTAAFAKLVYWFWRML